MTYHFLRFSSIFVFSLKNIRIAQISLIPLKNAHLLPPNRMCAAGLTAGQKQRVFTKKPAFATPNCDKWKRGWWPMIFLWFSSIFVFFLKNIWIVSNYLISLTNAHLNPPNRMCAAGLSAGQKQRAPTKKPAFSTPNWDKWKHGWRPLIFGNFR